MASTASGCNHRADDWQSRGRSSCRCLRPGSIRYGQRVRGPLRLRLHGLRDRTCASATNELGCRLIDCHPRAWNGHPLQLHHGGGIRKALGESAGGYAGSAGPWRALCPVHQSASSHPRNKAGKPLARNCRAWKCRRYDGCVHRSDWLGRRPGRPRMAWLQSWAQRPTAWSGDLGISIHSYGCPIEEGRSRNAGTSLRDDEPGTIGISGNSQGRH